jgi:hypothetical protein
MSKEENPASRRGDHYIEGRAAQVHARIERFLSREPRVLQTPAA